MHLNNIHLLATLSGSPDKGAQVDKVVHQMLGFNYKKTIIITVIKKKSEIASIIVDVQVVKLHFWAHHFNFLLQCYAFCFLIDLCCCFCPSLHCRIKIPPDCTTELNHNAYHFLQSVFDKHDKVSPQK